MPSLQSSIFRMFLLSERIVGMTRLPLRHQRAIFEQRASLSLLPSGLQITSGELAGRKIEWLRYPQSMPGMVLLYLHGGAYVMGSPLTHRNLVARIAKAAGIDALQIDYRLAPEHPFPAGLEDVLAAYDWLQTQGYSAEKIILGGDSAGAGLALALMLTLRERGAAQPRAAVLLSPWIDMVGEGDSIRSRRFRDPYLSPELVRLVPLYCRNQDPRNPLISPVFADLHGLPALFIQVGNEEILLSDATRLAENAHAAGLAVELEIWPYMWHVWQLFAPWLPEALEAIQHIAAFVNKHARNIPQLATSDK